MPDIQRETIYDLKDLDHTFIASISLIKNSNLTKTIMHVKILRISMS